MKLLINNIIANMYYITIEQICDAYKLTHVHVYMYVHVHVQVHVCVLVQVHVRVLVHVHVYKSIVL